MLVVWINSTGPEILLRMGPLRDPLTVWLLDGLPSESPPPKTLARRVVNALAKDMFAVVVRCGENGRFSILFRMFSFWHRRSSQ